MNRSIINYLSLFVILIGLVYLSLPEDAIAHSSCFHECRVFSPSECTHCHMIYSGDPETCYEAGAEVCSDDGPYDDQTRYYPGGPIPHPCIACP